MDEHTDGTIRRGELLTLVQPSVRRRAYELRRGDQVVGSLRFRAGRRSEALAELDGAGPLALVASGGLVAVTRAGGVMVASVERRRGGSAIVQPAGGPAFHWRRSGRWHRWAMGDGDQVALSFTASQGLLRSSVRVTAERSLAWPAGGLLCLIGAFLALHVLQAEVDASAGIGGIVAAGAG